jgi:hypothetical protein
MKHRQLSDRVKSTTNSLELNKGFEGLIALENGSAFVQLSPPFAKRHKIIGQLHCCGVRVVAYVDKKKTSAWAEKVPSMTALLSSVALVEGGGVSFD